jgi:hypothetical protein
MHGNWCGARTFPLRCKYCRANAFLFMCNCGSVALFESLGPPWPRHLCSKAPGADGDDGPTYGLSPGDASRIVRAFAESRGLPVPPLSWEAVEVDTAVAERIRTGRPPPIEAVPARDGPIRAVGTIRELILDVDPLVKLGVSGPLFSAQVLRKVPRRVLQLTIQEPPAGAGPIRSLTAWMDPHGPGASLVRKEAVAAVELAAVSIVGLEPFWVVKQIEVLV